MVCYQVNLVLSVSPVGTGEPVVEVVLRGLLPSYLHTIRNGFASQGVYFELSTYLLCNTIVLYCQGFPQKQ